ncbi:MAG: hypothetical protein IPM24_01790 [Bryobacterales bacterium]|nr:hypothetical protein [Bryobacterales bacterium]
MLRSAFLLLALVLPALPADPASAPRLPHRVVPDWPRLPKGWNLAECSGVAVDRNDNVWVFNRGAHPVIQFDRDGNFLHEITESGVQSAHGIKVDPEGHVWAVDVAGHRLLKFNPLGRLLVVLGWQEGKNDDREAFNRPTGLAFAADGGFYVSDGYVNSRVVKYSRNAEYEYQWGSKGTGDGQFDLVHDVALDAVGRVYVADRTNERIQIFDAKGKFLGKWTGLGAPWGLAYSVREDALYMADGKNDRVLKLSLKGEILGVLGSHGKMPGQFDFAHHIAVDSSGAIYVAEIKNFRVQKFAPPR